ncbi:MAG: DUF1844 domain-containing protein [Ignavibacteria bacterium]|nr:DUF1844 domain-containing protein [Ignavibacteria bacterium]
MEDFQESSIKDLLFLQVVMQFQGAAMIGMGKLKNPMTDKIEKNLEQAKFAIDVLDMLKDKTKGNLKNEEEKFLTQIITDLKLNYVDEVNSASKTSVDTSTEEKK